MTTSARIRDVMRTRGFIPAVRVAETTGYTTSAIRRWVSEGKIIGISTGGEVFIQYVSLVDHLGSAGEALGVKALDPSCPLPDTDPPKSA